MIVAHQNQIVMGETLEKALDRLFPSDAQPQTVARTIQDAGAKAGGSEPAALQDGLSTARALAHYRRAMQAQRNGNWGLYGEEIRQLGEVLERRNDNP